MSIDSNDQDNDTGADYWADVKPWLLDESKRKRAANRRNSATMLRDCGIAFDDKNDGAHLIVSSSVGLIDFWPGTGLWICRSNKKKARGVRQLLKFVRASK